MKYRSYPSYTDTKVQWLEVTPDGWRIKPLKFTALINSEVLPENTDDEYEFEYVDIGSVSYGKGITKTERLKYQDAPSRARRLVKNGDSIVSTVRTYLKAIASIGEDAESLVVSTGFCVIRAQGILSPRYCSYLIHSPYFVETVVAGSVGVSYPATNASGIAQIKVPLPTLDEQHSITKFLDKETAKIDTLIEKQQQLIKLLQEKRQAVISHAVTKGLDPDVKMKDSGVEWLGEVPEHWVLRRIKHLSQVISKGTTPTTIDAEFVDEGIRFIKAENIGKSMSVRTVPEFYITETVDAQLARSRLKENDVLVIIAGATTGLTSILSKDMLPANTNQAVSFIRPIRVGYSKMIAYWLSTDFSQRRIWMGAVQAAQPNLSMETLGNIPIVGIADDELGEILNWIEEKTEKIDELITKGKSSIDLIAERRTALISAAVTGKIDVRNAA